MPQAENYMNPFAQPEPSTETGPGTHFRPDDGTSNTPYRSVTENLTGTSTTSTNPFRRSSLQPKSTAYTHTRAISNGSSNGVAAPRSMAAAVTNDHRRSSSNGGRSRERIPSPHLEPVSAESRPRQSPDLGIAPPKSMADARNGTHRRNSSNTGRSRERIPSPHAETFPGDHLGVSAPQSNEKTRARRVSSLKERFPGDPSVRPLDMLKSNNKAANRSPHLRKQHMPGADTIDKLDIVGGRYHHEGPYDAALLARNMSSTSSPVAALEHSNEEALKATPREKIRDSVVGHRPLDGVAVIPPGARDEFDRVYDYEEGTNMMIDGAEGGEYRRWQGVVSLPPFCPART